MADEYLLKAVHEEFAKRVEEENTRQNHRIKEIEETVKQFLRISTSVERLAVSTENIAEELTRQGNTLAEQNDRIKDLEGADGKKWRSLIEKIITAVIGLLVGFLGAKFGLK